MMLRLLRYPARFDTLRRRHLSRRGFASLIGILIVLVIIMYLTYDGYFKPVKGGGGKRQAEMYIDRAKVTACTANRDALRAQLAQATTTTGGMLPSTNILRRKLGNFHCPMRTGIYQIDNEGNVYCTLHDPAPESKSGELISLQDPDELDSGGDSPPSSPDESQ